MVQGDCLRGELALHSQECAHHRPEVPHLQTEQRNEERQEGEGEETYAPLLAKVKPDSREFPETLLSEHKKAARLGATVLVGFLAILTKAVILPLGNLITGGIVKMLK